MTKNLEAITEEFLQQRLLEEVEAQVRLQTELKIALESERDLRLENELLWVYLGRKYPARVEDAAGLLARLKQGSDLASELQSSVPVKAVEDPNLRQKVRRAVGKLPGVRWAYHGLKNIGK